MDEMRPLSPIVFDPLQARIHRRLGLIGEGPAAFYRDACLFMATTPQVASTTHFVAHCLREIESALRDVLEPVAAEPQDELKAKKGKGKASETTQRDEILAVLAGLSIPDSDPVAQTWLGVIGRNNACALHARAHRAALGRPRPVDAEFNRFWDEMQTVLDVVLDRFEARYVTFHRRVDELLAVAAPDERDVVTLRDKVPNSLDALEYFFGKAGPAWLAPLNAAGFFGRPPETEEGYRAPTWPQSQYLARMAAAEPEQVLGIAQLVADTRNVRVQEDLMEAALAMPPSKAAELVPNIVGWMGSMHLWFQPESIGNLAAQFAKGGEVEAALALGRAFLDAAQAVSGQSIQFDTWHYNRVLNQMVPDLLAVASRSTLDLFCNALDDAIRHYENLGGAAGPEDFSWSWQPSIERSRDATSGDVKSVLVSRSRDIAEQIAEADPSAVREIVRLLEERPWHVFHRLALHLLRMFPDAAPELIIVRLTDRALFEALGPSHEYALLARAHFGNLDNAARARVLTWIADGPTHEGIAALEGHHAVRYMKRWQRDHLAPISDHLPAPWRSLYEGLNLELGLPDSENGELELVGPTSPASADSLRAMGVEEIAAYTKMWEPSDVGMGPSRVGLAGELTQLVIAEPGRFAAGMSHFKGTDSTYARGALRFDGLREAGCSPRLVGCARLLPLARAATAGDRRTRRIWCLSRSPLGMGATGGCSTPCRRPQWRSGRSSLRAKEHGMGDTRLHHPRS